MSWGGGGGADAQTAHQCHIQHSPGTPTTGLRECGNDTSRSTGRSGRQNAATRRNMRREERVTVQGPVKEQQRNGISHRGRGGGPGGAIWGGGLRPRTRGIPPPNGGCPASPALGPPAPRRRCDRPPSPRDRPVPGPVSRAFPVAHAPPRLRSSSSASTNWSSPRPSHGPTSPGPPPRPSTCSWAPPAPRRTSCTRPQGPC